MQRNGRMGYASNAIDGITRVAIQRRKKRDVGPSRKGLNSVAGPANPQNASICDFCSGGRRAQNALRRGIRKRRQTRDGSGIQFLENK